MEDFIDLLEDSIALKDDQLKITPDMDLINDVGMTSLDMMVVIVKIERKYDKKLPLEKLIEVKTVTDLYNLATEKTTIS